MRGQGEEGKGEGKEVGEKREGCLVRGEGRGGERREREELGRSANDINLDFYD